MRVRLRFSKLGKVRFTSHRDLARIWERALRRARLPVVYTEGFSPRPKLSFGLALPTGSESLGEYLDVELDASSRGACSRAASSPTAPRRASLDVDALPARLDPALPVGFRVQGAAEIPPGTASLQQAVVRCTWRLTVPGASVARLTELVDAALAADSLVVARTRKGHEVHDDVRPAMRSLEVVGPTSAGPSPAGPFPAGATLVAELDTQPRSVRPSELLVALGGDLREERVCRTHQWMQLDGALREPIALPHDATWAPHVQARAS